MTDPSTHVSTSINCPAEKVYAFVSNPANLPQWAAGLSSGIEKIGDDWVAESPMGSVTVKFADNNPFGILDHDVTFPDGRVFYNPMRVFPNGAGCEVVFTLYLLPQMTEAQLEENVRLVEKDLETLKGLMEG